MMRQVSTAIVCALGMAAGTASSQNFVTGGQTSVLLDTELLASAANLNLSGVSSAVIAPGNLGPDSVAFSINGRGGDPMVPELLPTTFEYATGLASFSGAIEHSGSVFFNEDAVEVGDFTIGFDGSRTGEGRSGFFVASTVGIEAILFDVGEPSSLTAEPGDLTIAADLLVSSEFAAFLLDAGLASSDLTGADVGDALVQAVPSPAGALALIGFAGLASRRRRG